ncbi:MAG: amino acid ABC transporter permease [Betaproteobacteria bacterium]|nr:MAG: amino acid ABC transporter permease [Betaproteobacteria bacterium]
MYHFEWSVLWGEWGLRLLDGLYVTVKLALLTMVFAFAAGFVFGIIRWTRNRYLEPICWIYVEFARNTPPLVQILFWYFSAVYILPHWLFAYMRDVGFEFAAAVFALSIYHGAFVAEIVRAGLNSISLGQVDAARSLGLNFRERMLHVTLPQAIRVLIPPLTNEAVGLLKNTSLAMAIGVTEIAYQTKYIDTYTFRGVEALVAASALYICLCLIVSGLGRLATKRFSRHVDTRRTMRVTALLSE